MDNKQEIKSVLQDTIKIIELQATVSPYWHSDMKISPVTFTVGDVARLYYALELLKANNE